MFHAERDNDEAWRNRKADLRGCPRARAQERHKTTEAFKKVAAETGRSVGTVQTSYYRIARQTPGSGVKARSRKNKAAAKTAAVARGIRRTPANQADQLNEMARELEDRAKKLRAIAKSIDGLEKDAETARRIAHLLS